MAPLRPSMPPPMPPRPKPPVRFRDSRHRGVATRVGPPKTQATLQILALPLAGGLREATG